MSDTVLSKGFLAAIVKPQDWNTDKWNDLYDRLYNHHEGLSVNQNGIVECDFNRVKNQDERTDIFCLHVGNGNKVAGETVEDFLQLLKDVGVEVKPETIKPYTCIWYNGADSPTWDITEEELLNA